MSTKYNPEQYQFYTQLGLISVRSSGKKYLADKLLNFNINQLSPDDKAEFYKNLSTFRMPINTLRTPPKPLDKKKYQDEYRAAGIAYNNAIAKKITEIENSGLPDVPDIELDINDEKTLPLGINKVTNEPAIENPTMGGKQRKVSCGCSKHGGKPRNGQRGKSKQRSKSRQRSKSKSKSKQRR